MILTYGNSLLLPAELQKGLVGFSISLLHSIMNTIFLLAMLLTIHSALVNLRLAFYHECCSLIDREYRSSVCLLTELLSTWYFRRVCEEDFIKF